MGSAPRLPPLPVDAYINAGRTQCVIAFDQFLESVPALNAANWAVVHGYFTYTVTAAQALGSRCLLALTTATGEPPTNGVSYTPPPFDVRSRWLLPAAEFLSFPIREGP